MKADHNSSSSMICLFSKVEILEENNNGNGVLVKEFFNVHLEVDANGFFVANGKWKVPWKKITTFSTNEENTTMIHLSTIVVPAAAENNHDNNNSNSNKKKKTSKGLQVQAFVDKDLPPPLEWPSFQKYAQKKWKKLLAKKERRASAWVRQEEAHDKALAKRQRHANAKPKGSRAERFFWKNRSNLKTLLGDDDDDDDDEESDDDDDETFHGRHHKVLLAERKNQQQEQAETTTDAQRQSTSSDEEEGEVPPEAINTDTPSSDRKEEKESSPSVRRTTTTTRHKKHGKKILKRRSQRQVRREDSSSDEDDDILFGTSHHEGPTTTLVTTTTTPMRNTKNVVTPGASWKKKTTTTTALLDDDDDDDDDEILEDDSKKEQPPKTLEAPPPPPPPDDIQNVAPITNYFTTFKKTTTTSAPPPPPPAAANNNNNNNKKNDNTVPSPPGRRKQQHTTVQKKVAAPSDFFAPRSKVATKTATTAVPREEEKETVVVGSPAPRAPPQTPPRGSHHPPKEEPAAAPRTPPRSAYKHLYQSVTKQDNDDEDDHIMDYVNPRHLSPIRHHHMASPLAERMSGGNGGGTVRKQQHNKRQHYFGTKAPPSRASAVLALDQADQQQSPARRNLYQGLDMVVSSPSRSRNKQRSLSPPRKRSRILTTPRSPSSSSLVVPSPKKGSSPPLEPPPVPMSNKFRGLRNLGNTCYINSSLQMLFSIPEFAQALAPLAAAETPGRTQLVQSFCETFQDVIHHPSSSEEGYHQSEAAASSAKQLKLAVDETTDQFRGYQQRDAHEFLGHLIDEMHEELEHKKTNKDDDNGSEEEDEEVKEPQQSSHHLDEMLLPTDDYFRLNVEVNLKCKSCGYSRSKEEMYRYLSVDIDESHDTTNPPRPTVERCLDLFFQPEDREIKCEKCKDGTQATQTMRILSRPRALLLHLKRFKMVEHRTKGDDGKDEVSYSFQKNKAPVELNDKVSLDRFLSDKATASVLSSDYSLRSIVHHIGTTANSGHYTADALRETSKDGKASTQQWVSYDDSTSIETTLGEIQKSLPNRKTAYMLLYSTD